MRLATACLCFALLLLLSPLPLLCCCCLLLCGICLAALGLVCAEEGIDIVAVWGVEVVLVAGHGDEVIGDEVIVEVVSPAVCRAHAEMRGEEKGGKWEEGEGGNGVKKDSEAKFVCADSGMTASQQTLAPPIFESDLGELPQPEPASFRLVVDAEHSCSSYARRWLL